MAGNVVSLCTAGSAVLPLAGETEIVGTLATNVIVAEMVVECFWITKGVRAVLPKTFMDRWQLLFARLLMGRIGGLMDVVVDLLAVVVAVDGNGGMGSGGGRGKLGHGLPGMREEKTLVGVMHDCF